MNSNQQLIRLVHLSPLSQVLNSAESILSSSDQQLLEMVQRNSKRLMKMVNSLLEFTKIDAGHMRAHFIPTDLPARTREIASVFEPVARQFNLQYVVDCPSWPKRKRLCLGESKRGRTEIGVMEHIARNEEGKVQEWKQHEQEEEGEEEDVYVDVDLWEKVLLNLLSNAFKHCFEGCVTLSLRKIRQDHLAEGGECNMVELSLTDTGIGISADNLPRIFDQFYCVRNGVTRSYEGMGIGLSFVKQIVEMHGGKIFAESELGKGSKFVVRIPVGSGHLPKECLDEIPHMEQETMEQNTQEPMSLQYSVDFPAFQKNSTLFVGEAAEWLVSSPNTTTPRKDSVGSSHVVRRISNAASANSVVSDFQSTRPDTVPSVQDYFSPIAVQQQEKPTVLVVDDNVDMRAYISHILSPHFDVITARDSSEAMELALTMCSETIGEVSEGIIETEKKGDEHGEPREHRPRRELSLVLTDIMMPVIDGIELLKKFRSHPSTQNLPIMLLTAKIGDNANVDGLLPFSPRELIARVFMHIRLYRMRIAAIQARHQIKLLEAASEAKSKLIALVSHELRTPLQSIIGTIEILQDTELDEEQSDSMYTIRYSSQVLLSIISDILDVAKIGRQIWCESPCLKPHFLPEAGNFSFDLNDFNPRTLVQVHYHHRVFLCVGFSVSHTLSSPPSSCQHATDILADKAASKGLELICHVDSNIPDVIHQDAARITQCLCNLIGNAIKFTPQGSVVVRVKQVLMETKHVVENENENTGSRDLEQRTVGLYIEVVDTGIGLSQDSLTKIFEPFRQANSPSTRNHEGVGLGLFISQQLVYKVGGEIGVRSQPNAGSTFWFTWPFLSVDATHSYPSLETIPPVLKYNLRILVVMPNILAGDAAREHLESAGIVKIDVVLNVDAGRGLLETLRAGERRFDAVILDSNLKREECIEFVKWIRNLDESILILLVASRGEHGSSDAGLKAVYQGVHRSTLVNKISRRLNADNGFLHRDKSTALTRSTVVSVSSSPAMSISPSMSNSITAVRTSTPPNPKQTLKPVGESAAPSPLSPHRILVAEDNLINQTLLIKQLKKLGYGADPAGNGIEVLNRLEETEKDVTGQGHKKRYSLVLMDVDMPICDGFEATRRIRQSNSDFKDVIIVAITANGL
ncbi:hypothetical protein BC936DRAFT_145960 [Jimgerdemannia flammicorona]|uniref:histidine kinase n=1 Tax=Jimgerdemannia flammicorona TaxID=994334 RepID=A0A433D8U4_9FUNG|nr:hypothetical protein BC936DRAFT_145960 [Jimgerdemannia flammicorona]